MTFRSTSLRLGLLRAAGFVEPGVIREQDDRRGIYVTPEIATRLKGSTDYYRGKALIAIDRFRSGSLVTVSRQYAVRADLEKLVDVDEVWALCFRNPKPGGRLLGRFFETNVFVGFRMHSREELAGDGYEKAAAGVIDDWNRLLRSPKPVSSDQIEDYITHVVRDMDDDD